MKVVASLLKEVVKEPSKFIPDLSTLSNCTGSAPEAEFKPMQPREGTRGEGNKAAALEASSAFASCKNLF